MPHRTFAQVVKRRLVGKEGRERIREVRALLEELPDYKNGPYADLRKWVNEEMARTRVRSKTVHRDSIAVRRQGAAQICLVGAPNAGKSSLLQALSNVQIKTGDYAFTTTRPVPATTRIGGVLVQLVEIPGLIEGASEDANRLDADRMHEHDALEFFPRVGGVRVAARAVELIRNIYDGYLREHRKKSALQALPSPAGVRQE
jgi:predicted GTPase